MRGSMRSIEVLIDDRIQMMYFPYSQDKKVDGPTKKSVLRQIDYSAPSAQIEAVSNQFHRVLADVHQTQYFENISKYLKYENFSSAFMLLTFVLNLQFLVTWASMGDNYTPEYSGDGAVTAMHVCSVLHLLASTFMFIIYYIDHPVWPSDIKKAVADSAHAAHAAYRWLACTSGGQPENGNDEDENNEDEKKIAHTMRGAQLYEKLGEFDERNAHRLLLLSSEARTHYSLASFGVLIHLLYIMLSALGVGWHEQFYAFHLLHIIQNNDTLEKVLESVSKPASKLGWVFLLLIIIIYIYSVFAFTFMQRAFDQEEGQFCTTMWECFTTSIRLGFLSGGGLGEALVYDRELSGYGFGRMFQYNGSEWRIIFDLSYFIIITIIGMNIVFGLIIDTFSQLREEKDNREEAQESQCIVCSLKSIDFDRDGNGWDVHKKEEHHLWDYLFFFALLEEKAQNLSSASMDADAIPFTYVELRVAQQLNAKQFKFFPMGRALALEDSDGRSGAHPELEVDINTTLGAQTTNNLPDQRMTRKLLFAEKEHRQLINKSVEERLEGLQNKISDIDAKQQQTTRMLETILGLLQPQPQPQEQVAEPAAQTEAAQTTA